MSTDNLFFFLIFRGYSCLVLTSHGFSGQFSEPPRMSGGSGQEGIEHPSHPEPGPRPSRKLTLADIAGIFFAHLTSTAQDDCDLAEVALLLALSDAAGVYGRPRTSRDALVNSLWASLAKVADEKSRPKTFQWPMPSLYDVQQQSSARTPQPSLLKVRAIFYLYLFL